MEEGCPGNLPSLCFSLFCLDHLGYFQGHFSSLYLQGRELLENPKRTRYFRATFPE